MFYEVKELKITNYELMFLGVRCWVLGIKMFVGANTCVRSYS